MPIREFFHLIHVVDDMPAAKERFGALFGASSFNENWSDLDRRWATFMMLGDMMMEVIEPSDAADDQQHALSKFHSRFGQHLHSLSWYVDVEDMPVLFKALLADGVRVVKPGGGFFPVDTEDPGKTIFTHPKDTAGQLEFVAVEDRPLDMDPRSAPGWSPLPPESSPLTVVGVAHITTGTLDLRKLKEFFERVLSAVTLKEDAGSAFLRVGTQSIVELAAPTGPDSLLSRDIAANGELPHRVTFRVVDLEAAELHCTNIGVRVLERTGSTLALHPDDTFGAVMAFTDTPPVG
jgi:catechol 2,3-dioxygenase-like lactoylglutathione lyase family enzyme